MITTHVISLHGALPHNKVKEFNFKLNELYKLGRIISVLPFDNPHPPRLHHEFNVLIEEETPVDATPTVDNQLADRLEALSKVVGSDEWFAAPLLEQEDDDEMRIVSVGTHDVSDKPSPHHYEDTLLEVWDNPNYGFSAADTSVLIVELVNNLPTIIKALRN